VFLKKKTTQHFPSSSFFKCDHYFYRMKSPILLVILSGLSFLVVNFLVKIMGMGPQQALVTGLQQFPAHELVLARSIISFAISAYIIRKKGLPFFGYNKKWLIVRGCSGMIALTIFFHTIYHLPLAIASTVQYLAPIFTLLFAILILGERIRLIQWLFVLMAFTGVLLLGFEQQFSSLNASVSFYWIGLGILSAAFSGLAYVAIVKLKATDQPISIVLYFPMIAIPFMGVWCLYDFVLPNGIEWFILLAIGIFTQLAQVALTKALHYGSATMVTPFQYLGAIYAGLVGYFIFHEQLSFLAYFGIGLILIGVVANSLVKKR
jgi:drug/metabolite transporter (DMT)-like permease